MLRAIAAEKLEDWSDAEARDIWPVLRQCAQAQLDRAAPLRAALEPDDRWRAFFAAALGAAPELAGAFLRENAGFYKLTSPGFLTGYYQPVVPGALEPSDAFPFPLLARPDDLVNLHGRPDPALGPELAGARRDATGALSPYPARAEIESAPAGFRPAIWLADAAEAFLIQVQGGARVRLADGGVTDLIYDGRNGRPYTSIGRLLIEAGEIAPADMSLATLKAWLRRNGLAPGERGREILWRNESYVFFRRAAPAVGPIGGLGAPLTPLRSIAVDRNLWPYGALMWIRADLAAARMSPAKGRLWAAQDTGSAILGPARIDLYMGSGEAAGAAAGSIRHEAEVFLIGPRGLADMNGAAT